MKVISSSMVNVLSKINQLMIIKDAPFGKMESAPNALRDGTSTNKNIAHLSVIFALLGIKLESALNAITDILSAKDNVLLMTTEVLFQIATCSAKHGLEKNVQNALKEPILMLMEYAAQSAHNATPLINQLEHV